MKIGDKVRVTWHDGLVDVGNYIGKEQGYEVFLDKNKKRFVCLLSHVKSVEVIKKEKL